jgi:hypothetical protein
MTDKPDTSAEAVEQAYNDAKSQLRSQIACWLLGRPITVGDFFERIEALAAERDALQDQLTEANARAHSAAVLCSERDARIAELQAQLAKAREDALREAAGEIRKRWATTHAELEQYILALIDTPTPAPSPDDVRIQSSWPKNLEVTGVGREPGFRSALTIYFSRCFSDDDMRQVHNAIRAAATDPATVAAIIERAGK